jgi:pyruvate dehydrogenase E2 component (dihydrolipoamide acetyltransferase)
MDGIVSVRERYNKLAEEKLSLNAFLMKLAAEAIKHHPMINSTWNGDTIVKHGRIDIALAVALEEGLVAPVVRDCGSKGVKAIDQEIKELVGKAKNNRLAPEDYENATFTISNLGSFGIEEFTAIINPPGSAILAVGKIEKRPIISESEEILVRSMMAMTLSCDHRIIDGAVGAAFMQTLKNMMESPLHALF